MSESTFEPPAVVERPFTVELLTAHGLTEEEGRRIVAALGREPTMTEVGIFSAMWSEHCSYKNSKPLLKGFPKQRVRPPEGWGRVLVGAGEENAGIVDVGNGWAVAFKIESHNHPSAVEPFEGAATGVGGIIRDIFTMGARPVLLTNSLRFGDLASPAVRRLVRGVVSGISHYGNCMGIPNVGGDVAFDPSYDGNPLVNALCLGVLRHDQIKRGTAAGVGNPVYYVGAATGRDGLGGAAFSSRELTDGSSQDRPAVQKGDPFMEKLLLEACLEAMEVPGLCVGVQDMGAAGLTCATCETAARGGAGIEIELARVPQREPGMNAYEILLSESQERMLFIVQRGREAELEAVFEKWDLHAVAIGEVTDTGRMVVRHGGRVVADIPARVLTDDAPVYVREVVEPPGLKERQAWTPGGACVPDLDASGVEAVLPRLLAHPTVASKRWIWRQYDHTVQAGTVVEPGSDAGVVRVRLGEDEVLLAITNDGNGRHVAANPYRGGLGAMAEALRNLACAGAEPLGMTDNLNFGKPGRPASFHALAESVRGLAEACRRFDVPVVGGNVSLNNESPAGSIDPTPVVSVVGRIADPGHVTRSFATAPGEVLVLLGGRPAEVGASLYLQVVHGLKAGDAPAVDLDAEAALHAALGALIKGGLVRGAHDLSDGGLLPAVVEMLAAPAQTLGAVLELAPGAGERVDALLFGECHGRAVVVVAESDLEAVLAVAAGVRVPAEVLGWVNAGPDLVLAGLGGGAVVRWSMRELREAWETTLERAMALPGLA